MPHYVEYVNLIILVSQFTHATNAAAVVVNRSAGRRETSPFVNVNLDTTWKRMGKAAKKVLYSTQQLSKFIVVWAVAESYVVNCYFQFTHATMRTMEDVSTCV